MARGKPRRCDTGNDPDPFAGTAIVAGYDVTRQSQKVRSSVGFLSTATALYGRLSAEKWWNTLAGCTGSMKPFCGSASMPFFGRLEMNDFRDRRCDAFVHRHETKSLHRAHLVTILQ